MRALVLSVGQQLDLLALRNEVLREAGFAVRSSTTLEDATALALAGDFDVVVLCRSLPCAQRQQFIYAVRAMKPSLPIVALRGVGENELSGVDAILDPLEGAEKLIAGLDRAIAARERHRPMPVVAEPKRSGSAA